MRISARILLAALTTTVVLAAPAEAQKKKARPAAQAPAPKGPTYDWTATSNALESFVPKTVGGLTFAIMKDGRLIYTQSYGTQTINTILPIASATKMPSAMAILTLVDRGALNLDKPVGSYLDGLIDWPADKANITMRMLLNHTSGIQAEPPCLSEGLASAVAARLANGDTSGGRGARAQRLAALTDTTGARNARAQRALAAAAADTTTPRGKQAAKLAAALADTTGARAKQAQRLAAAMAANGGAVGRRQGRGVLGDPSNPAPVADPADSNTLKHCAAQIAAAPLEFAPGTQFAYGGGGYQIAGYVAEAIAGKPFTQFFNDVLGRPLGLMRFAYVSPNNPRIAGGARSDVGDYLKIEETFRNGGVYNNTQLLSKAMIDEMKKNQIANVPKLRTPGGTTLPGYSFGLWISDPKIHPSSKGPEFSDQGLFGATPWIDMGNGYSAMLLIQSRTAVGTQIWNAVRPLVNEQVKKKG